MKKSLFTIVALLLIGAVMLCGCGKLSAENEAPKVIVFDSGYLESAWQEALFGKSIQGSDLPIVCIDNMEKMDAFSTQAKEHLPSTPIDGQSAETSKLSSFTDAVASYNEEFFGEKTLIVCYAHTKHTPALFEVNDISVDGNKLSVLVAAISVGVDYGAEGRLVFIEMPKGDLKGVTQYVAVQDTGELM